MAGPRRVIVGVSGSVRNLQALRQAAVEARARDAVLVAVHAWIPPYNLRLDDYGLSELWTAAAWQRVWDAFDAAFGGMPPDVETEVMVWRGQARFILGELAARDNDLLIIGTGRRGVFRHWWHARVARYCAAHATCAVLMVPPTALAREIDRPLLARLSIRRVVRQAIDSATRSHEGST